MKLFAIFFFTLIFSFSLVAKTPLQVQSENAQNILDRTISKINHSWEMMKYHFSKGNELMKTSTKKNVKEVIDKTKSKF